MIIPKHYPAKLSNILDAYVQHNLIPGWAALHYFDIADEFSSFFSNQGIQARNILIIGGRASPLLNNADARAEVFEPRQMYHGLLNQIHGERVNLLTHLNDLDMTQYDLVVYDLECGGLPGFEYAHSLNRHFKTGLPVFGCKLKPQQNNTGFVRYLDDGVLFDELKARASFKLISSHMHLGVDKTQGRFVDFFNLTRWY